MTTDITPWGTAPSQIVGYTPTPWPGTPGRQTPGFSLPTPNPTFDDTIARAYTLATSKAICYDPAAFWTGPSGEQTTGEQVAHHLEATLALLQRDGWTRRYQDDEPDIDLSGDIDTMNPVAILRKLFALALWGLGFSTDKRYTLSDAMSAVVRKDEGDRDTSIVASRVLSTIIRASRGETENQNWPIQDAWASKLGRTPGEVMALLAAGVSFARRYGPRETVGF